MRGVSYEKHTMEENYGVHFIAMHDGCRCSRMLQQQRRRKIK